MAHSSRSFRPRGVSQSQRRKKAWTQVSGFPSPAGVLNSTLILGLSGGGGPPSPFSEVSGVFYPPQVGLLPESTIIRLRGSLNLPKNTASGVQTTTLAYGMGVMESGAAALGAFPNPASPEGADWDGWMFYRSLNSAVLDAASTVVDVKSMRKVQSGYSFIIVFGQYVQTNDDSVTAPISHQSELTARALVLLP